MPEERHGESVFSDVDFDTERGTVELVDCKETPGSGCESAERLRLIREGKKVAVDVGGLQNGTQERDSLGWYSFCADGGECGHVRGIQADLLAAAEEGGDIIVTHVWVARPHLGLSPGIEGDNFLLGEVTREFEHAITRVRMYKVDFGGVLGTHAIARENCRAVTEGDVAKAGVDAVDGDTSEPLLPTQDSTFTLDLPDYLGIVGHDGDNESSDPDWEADFQDWQGNSDSGDFEEQFACIPGVTSLEASGVGFPSHLDGHFSTETIRYLAWLGSL